MKVRRRRFKGKMKWNEPMCSCGGRGHGLYESLKSQHIQCGKAHSPYVGHVAVIIEVHNKKEAQIVANEIDASIDFVRECLTEDF